MYGPAFPFFEKQYGVSVAGVGLIASAHFIGSAVAPPLVGFLLSRISVRRVVVASFLVLIAGMFGVAFAPAWALAVLGALVGGLGLGGVSAALNSAYAALGTQAVNLVNAMFGVGSMLSPLLVAGFGPSGLSWPFLTVAACSALTLLAARIWGFPSLPPRAAAPAGGQAGQQVLFFALLIGLYVSLEVGFGAWSDKHLAQLGLSEPALILSAYWGGLTLGRVLTGLFGGRFAPERLVLGAALSVTACALLAAVSPVPVAAAAYVLTGLMLGPIFGTTLAWMARQLPPRWVSFLLVAGSVGGILMPALLGVLSAHFGSGAIPVTLAVTGGLLCLISLRLGHFMRQS